MVYGQVIKVGLILALDKIIIRLETGGVRFIDMRFLPCRVCVNVLGNFIYFLGENIDLEDISV